MAGYSVRPADITTVFIAGLTGKMVLNCLPGCFFNLRNSPFLFVESECRVTTTGTIAAGRCCCIVLGML